MSSPEIVPIIPTRENTTALLQMRQMDPGDQTQPQDQYERLLRQYDEARYAEYGVPLTNSSQSLGLFHEGRIAGFVELRDWRWGHQKPFEEAFHGSLLFNLDDSLPPYGAPDSHLVEGNPLGIMALHANELRSQELGGSSEVMKLLIERAIQEANGRELRARVLSRSALRGVVRLDGDPTRTSLVGQGFNGTGRTMSQGDVNYELFIRPATPIDDAA